MKLEALVASKEEYKMAPNKTQWGDGMPIVGLLQRTINFVMPELFGSVNSNPHVLLMNK